MNSEQQIHYMTMALRAAKASPDPSTQNGAVFVSADGSLHTRDCNRFPFGVSYTEERWERPLKYSIIEHAERNALYSAAANGIQTYGGTLISPWAACSDCARAIIQCGVSELIRLGNNDTNARWDDSIKVADDLMKEAGIKITEISLTTGITLRRDGQLKAF